MEKPQHFMVKEYSFTGEGYFCGKAYKYLMSHNHHTPNVLWNTQVHAKITALCTLESNKNYFSRDV